MFEQAVTKLYTHKPKKYPATTRAVGGKTLMAWQWVDGKIEERGSRGTS